jgi:S-adenosylmethionine decarboxylase
MHDIVAGVGSLFAPGRDNREGLQRLCGLTELLGDPQLTDHLFDPQGYSTNALAGATYATLHVTPQRRGSYVSFETNHRLDAGELKKLAGRLLETFQPARAELLVFQGPDLPTEIAAGMVETGRSERRLRCGYAVAYAHLVRNRTAPGRGSS